MRRRPSGSHLMRATSGSSRWKLGNDKAWQASDEGRCGCTGHDGVRRWYGMVERVAVVRLA
jgi:hypothetical protein